MVRKLDKLEGSPRGKRRRGGKQQLRGGARGLGERSLEDSFGSITMCCAMEFLLDFLPQHSIQTYIISWGFWSWICFLVGHVTQLSQVSYGRSSILQVTEVAAAAGLLPLSVHSSDKDHFCLSCQGAPTLGTGGY